MSGSLFQYCKIFKNNFFYSTHPMPASEFRGALKSKRILAQNVFRMLIDFKINNVYQKRQARALKINESVQLVFA